MVMYIRNVSFTFQNLNLLSVESVQLNLSFDNSSCPPDSHMQLVRPPQAGLAKFMDNNAILNKINYRHSFSMLVT